VLAELRKLNHADFSLLEEGEVRRGGVCRYVNKAVQILEKESSPEVSPNQATRLMQKLEVLRAAISSCPPMGPPSVAGEMLMSLPQGDQGPDHHEDGESCPHGDHISIAAVESRRRAGDWASLISLVEANLIAQLSGGTPVGLSGPVAVAV
jgi:hypothetical protein